MPIYKIESGKLMAMERTTFAWQGLRERRDMQSMLKERIEVISPDTLIVAEEFGEWEDSRRRIDLLGIDRNANLVVVELKRTEDGGHMELQAIRYAAMVSTLTFEKLVPIYAKFLADNGLKKDATESLLEFLDWNEPDEEQFGQSVKIVLASAEFSRELTTAVMWLNEYGLDIRCVRMHPYVDGDHTYLDVQPVIPIPEVADYQVRIREKKQKERESRETARDTTRYDITVCGKEFPAQGKRWLMFRAISGALASGATPESVANVISWRENTLFKVFRSTLSAEQVRSALSAEDKGGVHHLTRRYFCDEGGIFHSGGMTYVLSNQWGNRTLEAIELLQNSFPEAGIEVRASVAPNS